MEGINGSVNGLLEAQTQIWNHHLSFIKSLVLKCAVQLEIPDAIHNHGGRPMTISQLASALSIHRTRVRHLHQLMRFLVHSGYFAEQETSPGDGQEKGYVLTDTSRLLLKDSPLSQRPLVLSIGHVMTKSWDYMSQWLQDDSQGIPTPFVMAHGKTVWEHARDEPRFNDSFNEVMASDSVLSTSVVINKCRGVFEGLNSITDVGGGTGCMAKAIAKEFPDMECAVFDLSHVVTGLKGSKNLKFIGGNMFDEIPHSDAIMLKWVLHDWNDEDCVRILKRCKEAVSRKVIVIDMVLEEKKKSRDQDNINIETQLLYDMQMMAQVTGEERNEKEWAKLFIDAGFSSYKMSHVLGLRSLIEVYP
ncbi:hypothetical protein SLE2022_233800 [Rubroshorea leprosula]